MYLPITVNHIDQATAQLLYECLIPQFLHTSNRCSLDRANLVGASHSTAIPLRPAPRLFIHEKLKSGLRLCSSAQLSIVSTITVVDDTSINQGCNVKRSKSSQSAPSHIFE